MSSKGMEVGDRVTILHVTRLQYQIHPKFIFSPAALNCKNLFLWVNEGVHIFYMLYIPAIPWLVEAAVGTHYLGIIFFCFIYSEGNMVTLYRSTTST